jgi:hypothetical protein
LTRVRGGIKLPYPPSPGRVERSRPFYLLHGTGGFIGLVWPRRSLCRVRFDARHRLFRCADGTAWNLRGSIANRAQISGYPQDQPYVAGEVVSSEGYVLVNVSATA